MSTTVSSFIIFTDSLVNEQRKNRDKNRKLLNFFGEITASKFGCVFLPEDSEGFFEENEAAIIQLNFPTIVNVGDLLEDGKISFSLLSEAVGVRKAKLKKGVVLASSEETLKAFPECFQLFLLDDKKAPGHNGQYQIINNLSEVLPLLS